MTPQKCFQNEILPLKNKLYRLALRIISNAEDAEDIVQETMLKIWNRRDRWDEIESMEAFALTICRNVALDKARRLTIVTQTFDATEHDAPDVNAATNPEERVIQQDRIRIVRQIIASLPEKQRTAMQLRDFDNKSYKEIATIMGISEDQVKISIFRARQTVRQKYLGITAAEQ